MLSNGETGRNLSGQLKQFSNFIDEKTEAHGG